MVSMSNLPGVGPNAVNLREIAVLSNPHGFRVGVAAAMLFSKGVGPR